MANDRQPSLGLKKITPAKLDLGKPGNSGKLGNPDQARPTASRPAANRRLMALLPVAFLAVLAVIFILPAMVGGPETSTTDAKTAGEAAGASDNRINNARASRRPDASPAISPWQQAQQSELRKQTQDILARMLEVQQGLTAKGVEGWAGKDYKQALEYAAAGDAHYNEQDFAAAKAQYGEALALFSALLERVDSLFAETMQAGEQALLAGDAPAAHAAFDLALSIDAIDRKALAGKARADNIEQVFALIDQGERLLQQGQLAAAKSIFEQAYAIDQQLPVIAGKISEIDQRIKHRDFNKAMSAGFKQLESNRLTEARRAFAAALRISPNSKDAIAALNQTKHSITSRDIRQLITQAQRHEQAEQWREALETYQAALQLDANLANAQQGIERAKIWANAHARIDQILTQSERLYDREAFDEAAAFLAGMEKIARPGAAFKAKRAELQAALARAGKPIAVRLQSDNKTSVTLYKVGKLGLFTDKQLALRPGNYVAVGQREGYRDVRVEFLVEPDKANRPVLIVSQEKIALSE